MVTRLSIAKRKSVLAIPRMLIAKILVVILLANDINVSASECPLPCYCYGTKTNCASEGLTEIPANISFDTVNLHLRTNHIAELSPGTFSGLINVEKLYLQENALSVLPANAFSGLSSLRILDLNTNSITTIELGAFNGLTSLEDLWLSYNSITSLSANSFTGLPSLNRLYLYRNQIRTIDRDAFVGLTSLTQLSLEENNITSLSANSFTGLPSLDNLILYRNQIRTIDIDAFVGLTKLTGLLLNRNNIQELQANNFKGLSSLEWLSLQLNDIRSIANGAFEGLNSLKVLKLAGNKLSAIRLDMFTGLNNLEVLDVGGTLLTSIPQFVQPYLPNIKDLRLYYNNVTTLPDGVFAGLSKLEQIDLSYNQLESLPNDFYDVNWNVSYLDLKNNSFRTIPPFTSPNIPTFFSRDVEIMLSGNPITVIGAHAFQGFSGTPLNRLTLDMREMELEEIDKDAFKGIETKQFTIDLQDNRLTTLHQDTFSFFRNLSHDNIKLTGNPLACDCRMKAFKEWLDEYYAQEIVTRLALCQSPDSLTGRVFIEANATDMVCYAPVFDEPVESMSANEGESVLIDCTVAGSPNPSVYWVTPHGEWSSSMSHIFQVLPNNSLSIVSTSKEHAGVYACVATNAAGIDSAIRLLEVIVSPSDMTSGSSGATKAGFFIGGLFVGLLCVVIAMAIYLFIRNKRRKGQQREGRSLKMVGDNAEQQPLGTLQ